MNQIAEVFSRYITPHIQPTVKVAIKGATVTEQLLWKQSILELRMLLLEIDSLLVRLRAGIAKPQPKTKIECLADFEAALRRPH